MKTIKEQDEPTAYAKSLRADREAAQAAEQAAPPTSYFTGLRDGEARRFGVRRFSTPQEAYSAMHHDGEVVMVAMSNVEHAVLCAVAEAAKEIDRLSCNCPCMSLQAQNEFARCREAEAYKIELAGMVIKIREVARAALAALAAVRDGKAVGS